MERSGQILVSFAVRNEGLLTNEMWGMRKTESVLAPGFWV